MTAEANECGVGFEKGPLGMGPEGDLKGSGGIAHRDGDDNDNGNNNNNNNAINGPFVVVVDRDLDDRTEGDLDSEQNPEPAGAEMAGLHVGVNGVLLVNAGSAAVEAAVAGDREGPEGKGGDGVSGVSILENGHDRVKDVALIDGQTEPENLSVEKGELSEKDCSMESSTDVMSNAEYCLEKGELVEENANGRSCREKEKGEFRLENGHALVAKAELAVAELGDVPTESGHEEDSKAECEVLSTEDGCQEESALVVEAEHVPVASEILHQNESELVVEVEEKQEAETAITKTNQQTELKPGDEVEETQESGAVVKEVEYQGELESSVKVGEILEDETAPMETDCEQESALAVEVLEKQEIKTLFTETNQQVEFIELAAEVEGKQEPGAVTTEARHQGELESAVEIKEKAEQDIAPRETSCQPPEFVESTPEVQGKQEPQTVATESECRGEVEEKQEPRALVVDAEHQAESQPADEEKLEPEVMIVEVSQKFQLDASVNTEQQWKSETAVMEINNQRELESALEIEEKTKVDTAITDKDLRTEPESSVEVEGKPEVVSAFTVELLESESFVKVKQQQPHIEVAEMYGQEESQTIEAGERQESQPTVAANEKAKPESEKMEEHQPLTTKGSPSEEKTESVVHVEEKSDMVVAVSEANGNVECKSLVEVEPQQQSEINGQTELKLAVEAELEHHSMKVVADSKVVEVEEICRVEAIVDEPSVVKPKTSIKSGDEIGFPETNEAIPICHVDNMGSPTQSSGGVLVNGESEHASNINMQLEIEAPSGASNGTKLEDDACDSIADSNKELVVDHEDEIQIEHDVNDSDGCMAISVEVDRSLHKGDDEESTRQEVEASDGIQTPPDEPSSLALDGEKLELHAAKWQQCYIIRIPRSSEGESKTKIQHARLRLDEKTRSRDSIRVEIQKKRATFNEYRENLVAAKEESKAAKAVVAAKRQEIDSVQSMINKMKDASSIEDISDKIRNLEHTLQHESISLPLEKQYIREIKHLRHQREQISAKIGPQVEIQEAFDQRDQIEERFKTLKKELDSLRTVVLQTESKVKAAQKKFDDEFQLLKDLQEQFRVADDHRQEAYGHLKNLIKESADKNKYFYMYKNDQQIAKNYVFAGDAEGLQSHCSKQVEKIMELWNNDEEFRKQYVKSNVTSTIRRFRTLDGRSLGIDEEPVILHSNTDRSLSNVPLPSPNGSMPIRIPDSEVSVEKPVALAATKQVAQTNQPAKSKKSTTSRGTVKATFSYSVEIEEGKEIKQTKEGELANGSMHIRIPDSDVRVEKPVALAAPKLVAQTNQPAKSKKSTTSRGTVKATFSNGVEIEEEKEIKQTEEEELVRKAEELARKEEELRKEKAEAEMIEQRRLEQRAKAKEAEERKRRKAEKAQAKAEYKAQKEAEDREKKRVKKEKKKNKKAASKDTIDEVIEEDDAPIVGTSPPESAKETETTVRTAPKRSSRKPAAVKQSNKIQPLPLPLRNRGKRKMPTWMWVLLITLVVLLIFLAGNYVSFSNLSFKNFGF